MFLNFAVILRYKFKNDTRGRGFGVPSNIRPGIVLFFGRNDQKSFGKKTLIPKKKKESIYA